MAPNKSEFRVEAEVALNRRLDALGYRHFHARAYIRMAERTSRPGAEHQRRDA